MDVEAVVDGDARIGFHTVVIEQSINLDPAISTDRTANFKPLGCEVETEKVAQKKSGRIGVHNEGYCGQQQLDNQTPTPRQHWGTAPHRLREKSPETNDCNAHVNRSGHNQSLFYQGPVPVPKRINEQQQNTR